MAIMIDENGSVYEEQNSAIPPPQREAHSEIEALPYECSCCNGIGSTIPDGTIRPRVCPHCGGEAVLQRRGDEYVIFCERRFTLKSLDDELCPVNSRTRSGMSKEEAVALWNTRAGINSFITLIVERDALLKVREAAQEVVTNSSGAFFPHSEADRRLVRLRIALAATNPSMETGTENNNDE